MADYKTFLFKIGEDLKDTEIECLKFLFGLTKNEKEKITTAIQLFEKLEEKLIIHKHNINNLKDKLETIGRCDLVQKCNEYSDNFRINQSHGLSIIDNINTDEKKTKEINLNSNVMKCNSENNINDCKVSYGTSLTDSKTHKLISDSCAEKKNNQDLSLSQEDCKKDELQTDCGLENNNNLNGMKIAEHRFSKEFICLRNYQIELAEPALKKINNIICAPTGSGKTLTTAYVCKKIIEKNDKAKIIFIVNIRNLAAQQKEELDKLLTPRVFHIPETTLTMDHFSHYNVLVMTAQVFINMLEYDNTFTISDLDLLILDECHHTTLHHPYNKIMQIYYDTKVVKGATKLPQILGITASLGTDGECKIDKIKDHYIKLCANLDCHFIVIVKQPDNVKELNIFCPKPKENQIITCKPRETDEFLQTIINIMNKIEEQTGLCKSPVKGSNQYENWIVAEIATIEKTENFEKRKLLMCLQVLNTSLLIYADLTKENAICYLKAKIESEIYENIFKEIKFVDLLSKKNEKLENLFKKIDELCVNQCRMGIILIRTCFNVKSLSELIKSKNELKEKVEVFELLGQAHPQYGITDVEQANVIKKLKGAQIDAKKCCLLVATDIAQEGLDLPKCNFVIRYNFVSNEIGTVQSKGRARAKDSFIFLIMDENSVNLKREMENLERESKMQEALIKVQDSENLIEKIKTKQEQDMKARMLERDFKINLKIANPNEIQIVCKNCKQFLCLASAIKKKYSHYITIDETIRERTTIVKFDNPKVHSLDTFEGRVSCNDPRCNQPIGQYVRYHQGLRKNAHIISRNNIMMKMIDKNEYDHMPKTWDKLNFEIEELNDR